MSDTRIFHGTVLDKMTQRRYQGATVRLESETAGPVFANTDENGYFVIDLSDQEAWPAGAYTLTLYHPDAFYPKSKPGETAQMVTLVQDGDTYLDLEIVPDQETSNRAGWITLVTLLVILLGLLVLYFYLHQHFPNQPESLNPNLSAMIAEAQEHVQAVLRADSTISDLQEAAPVDSVALALQRDDSTTHAQQIGSILDVSEALFQVLREQDDPELIKGEEALIVESLFAQARSALDNGNITGLKPILTRLSEAVLKPVQPFFWGSNPWKLLEVLLWALGLTIIRLTIDVGRYLYKRTFFWRAIPHHIAILISIPVLAVLITFVLSLIQISFTLSEVGFVLDMDNVVISIVIAALIGIAPWKAWDFMRDLADQFFKKLSSFFASAEITGATPSSQAVTEPPVEKPQEQPAQEGQQEDEQPDEEEPPVEPEDKDDDLTEDSEPEPPPANGDDDKDEPEEPTDFSGAVG